MGCKYELYIAQLNFIYTGPMQQSIKHIFRNPDEFIEMKVFIKK